MHIHLNLVCKRDLRLNTLAIKLFNSGTSCFKLQLLTQHYEPVFLNVSLPVPHANF